MILLLMALILIELGLGLGFWMDDHFVDGVELDDWESKRPGCFPLFMCKKLKV